MWSSAIRQRDDPAPGKGFATLLGVEEWEIRVTNEILAWINALDEPSRVQVVDAIDRLAEAGPSLGRPLVDKLEGSQVHNLKELRPGSAGRSEIRILFVFDPWRSAILLVGGDKSGDWSGWYRRAIPHAEELYAEYLTEREAEEKDR
jgi:hypothetical protein